MNHNVDNGTDKVKKVDVNQKTKKDESYFDILKENYEYGSQQKKASKDTNKNMSNVNEVPDIYTDQVKSDENKLADSKYVKVLSIPDQMIDRGVNGHFIFTKRPIIYKYKSVVQTIDKLCSNGYKLVSVQHVDINRSFYLFFFKQNIK